jgi:EmrB/QacA subfamily drug resistance transporter
MLWSMNALNRIRQKSQLPSVNAAPSTLTRWSAQARTVPPSLFTQPATKPETGGERGLTRAAIAGLSLTVLLSTLNTSIVNVALPELAVAFDASIQSAQWIVIAFVLAITSLIVSAGSLADRVGSRRLLLVGIVVFTTAGSTGGLAPSLGWLIGARFFQGFGAAVMMAVGLALMSTVEGGKSGRAMGVVGSMSAIGTALGPALGGLLLSVAGWRMIFFINLPLGFLAFLLVRRALPADEGRSGTKFDVPGALLLAFGLVAYALAVTPRGGGFGVVNIGLLVLAVGAVAWFGVVQRGSSSPLVQIELLKNPTLRVNLVMTFLVAAVMMTTLVVGPFYLSRALAVSAATIGMALSVGPLAAALTAMPAGRLVDRVGTKVATVVGLMAAILGCLALVIIPPEFGLVGYIAPVAVMTAGYSLFQTANNTAVMRAAASHQRGLNSGLLNLARNLGLVTGASALAGVFAWSAGELGMADAERTAFAMKTTFATATGLLVGAFALAVPVSFRWRFSVATPGR